jgi:mRNA-degrading endonuclease RelE of RelBE toxin-antitoxin system
MKHQIRLTLDAHADLMFLRPFEQQIVRDGMRTQLSDEPLVETRNRKPLRKNPLAPWELRVGDFRVFYEVKTEGVVEVGAIGHKEHNRLFIRGKEVAL